MARRAAAAGAAVLAERPVGPVAFAELGGETKSAASDLVTEFDKRAEEAVRAVIAEARPHDAITGEEGGSTVPQDPSGYRWSVDPLDGTTNFVRGIPYYATSVAVAGPEGDWLAGAVAAPALKTTWWASQSGGAFRQDEGQAPVQLHGPDPDREARIIATGFGHDPKRRRKQLKELESVMGDFADVRRLGAAALDLCLVADGTLDAYTERGLYEHDWAAGLLIAETAGVVVTRPAEDSVRDGAYRDLPLVTAGLKKRTEPDERVTVRRIRPEDYKAVGRITVRSYLAAGHFDDPEHEYMKKIADTQSRAESATILVAERRGRIVGSVTIARHGEPWADIARPGELEFRLLAVDPGAQRSGAGRALLEAVIDEARVDPEITDVVLTTGSEWRAARSAYAALGFVGQPRRDWFVPNTDIRLLVYSLKVRP
ncbi:inositol monophosphatase family protein [Falsarthrobacter nasiphocae]|uniref:Fructose-1,6-bisphosphatase/inositol monophosphatase family enzyme/GNAT superfamily N-acetyltransferase n=1 Tax=Falsarthrobacter nasiphocae TaxID=189863 RepID=A0AAE4C7J1_9MICC|nr:inositol monophosphatase family protein [Falsarthrobacter nasiphocae]MDR6892599.1 fructose-1,6-bisphosphatase/inositol monophosphatase family enzyme/GNAT superfamily N-acetyltransferase [Falsarthrobacter nasiphocae]